MQDGATIIVKFKSGEHSATPDIANYLNNMLGNQAIQAAEPLFPGEDPGDLGSFYIATLDKDIPANQVIVSLNNNAEIDFAHEPAEKKHF